MTDINPADVIPDAAPVASQATINPADVTPDTTAGEGEDKGMFAAFGHGVGAGMTLGLSDLALTASLPSSLAMQYKANLNQTVGANPYSNLAGEGVGMLAGGAELKIAASALRGAGAIGRAAARMFAPLALQKGQFVRNAARTAVVGGAASGVSAAAEGDDPQQIAVATGGGAVAAPVIGGATAFLAPRMMGATTRAWGALADRLNVDPDMLTKAAANMSTALGRPVPMTALIDSASRGELQQIAAANPRMAAEFERAADTDPSVGKTINNLAKDRDTNFEALVDPIRDVGLRLSSDDLDYLQSDVVPNSGASQLFRKKLAQNMDSGVLTIGDADTLRQRFWAQHATKPGEGFDGIAQDITDFVQDRSTDYKDALDGYRADSNYLDGFTHGLKGKKISDATGLAAIALGKPEGQAGFAVGQVAKQERDRIGAVVPGRVSMPDEVDAAQIGHIAGGTLAHSPAIAAYHIARATSDKLRLPPPIAENIGRLLSDPQSAGQAIQLLKRAGAQNADIRDLALGTAAAGAAVGGAAVGGGAASLANSYTGAQ